jgi:hypothetical protein
LRGLLVDYWCSHICIGVHEVRSCRGVWGALHLELPVAQTTLVGSISIGFRQARIDVACSGRCPRWCDVVVEAKL